MHNKKIHMVTFLLLVIGGINLGLEGILNWGIGDILSDGLTRLIFILIGVSAVYEILTHKTNCTSCGAGSEKAPPVAPQQ